MEQTKIIKILLPLFLLILSIAFVNSTVYYANDFNIDSVDCPTDYGLVSSAPGGYPGSYTCTVSNGYMNITDDDRRFLIPLSSNVINPQNKNFTYSIKFKVYDLPTVANQGVQLGISTATAGVLLENAYPRYYLADKIFATSQVSTTNLLGNVSFNESVWYTWDVMFNETDDGLYFYINGKLVRTRLGYSFATNEPERIFMQYISNSAQSSKWLIDYIIVSDGLSLSYSEDLNFNDLISTSLCPLQNCIYYEQFNYVDGTNIDNTSYDYNFEYLTEIYNGKLTMYNNFTTQEPKFKYSFTGLATQNNFYDFNIGFKLLQEIPINSSILNPNGVIYKVQMNCYDSSIVSNIYFEFSKLNNLTYRLNVFEFKNGQYIPLGTDDIIVFYNNALDDLQRNFNIYFNVLTNEYSITFLDTNTIFTGTITSLFNSKCSFLGSFEISRQDYNNESSSLNIANIDYITLQGSDTFKFVQESGITTYGNVDTEQFINDSSETSILGLNEDGSEKTTKNALIDVASMFGLGKTEGGRFIFWTIIIIGFVFAFNKSEIQNDNKTPISLVIIVFGIIGGWYFDFYSNTILAFLILAIGGMIAVFFKNLTSNNNVSG